MGVITRLRRLAVLAVVAVLSLVVASSAAAAGNSTHYTGSTSDGGSWVADVPANWNGTLILYSHGYGTLAPADAPDPNTAADLLSMGYALAGSSYDPNGSLWALGSALNDQFQTLSDVENNVLPHQPTQVLAFGTSMGGLISALEDQNSNGRIQGALTTCGIVAGGLRLGNYQLDGEYAMTQLLNPPQSIQLTGYGSSQAAAATAAGQLQALAAQAQSSAQGRARLALAMAFLNTSDWELGQPMPAPNDYTLQEQEQYAVEFSGFPFPIMPFTVLGRQQIEIAAGGNPNWDAGVNFAREFSHSPYRREVQALYRAAGLNLHADLRDLTRHATTKADPQALRWMVQTSDPTGHLQVPELDLHTSADNLVPVQMETAYRHDVADAGSSSLLRQAYVIRQVHCNFTPSELVAGVLALQHRVDTGRWGNVAQPSQLEASANSLGLGDPTPPAFGQFWPGDLIGSNYRDFGSFRSLPWEAHRVDRGVRHGHQRHLARHRHGRRWRA